MALKISRTSVPINDSNFNNVSLLLKFEGNNNSTTFIDSSTNNLTVTPTNNAKISTAQSKFGVSSGITSVSNVNKDYIGVAATSLFNVGGLTPFTAECWFRASSAGHAGGSGIFSTRINTVYTAFEVRHISSSLSWLISNSAESSWTSSSIVPNFTVSLNVWYHIALVGDGTNIKLYVDGISKLSTSHTNWSSTNRPIYIGAGGDASFGGYIDEFRFTKGVARYTSNFIPTDRPFPTS